MLAEGVERNDVRVVQPGGRASLAPKTFAVMLELGLFGREDLDGHVTVQAALVREVDAPHAATTELADDTVVGSEGLIEELP
jgi:hypothetical protein